MSFMQPEIYKGSAYMVEANHGETHVVPCDVCPNARTNADLADYVGVVDAPDDAPTIEEGWLARMQAPGYLDATDWSLHTTEAEAIEYLREYYGLDEDETEEEE